MGRPPRAEVGPADGARLDSRTRLPGDPIGRRISLAWPSEALLVSMAQAAPMCRSVGRLVAKPILTNIRISRRAIDMERSLLTPRGHWA